MNGEWKKSTRSGGSGGNCVEVRMHDGAIQLRDSKDPGRPGAGLHPQRVARVR